MCKEGEWVIYDRRLGQLTRADENGHGRFSDGSFETCGHKYRPSAEGQFVRRPRMTTRGWLIVVAAVAMALRGGELLRRRAEYLREADCCSAFHIPDFMVQDEEGRRWNNWVDAMEQKYRFAADHPWVSVAPDPPAPIKDYSPERLAPH
jgi:hypothetical protein